MSPEEATSRAEAGVKKSVQAINELFDMFKSETIPDEDAEPLSKPASTVSEEISHLVKEKKYPQKRAVAAALAMQRAGKIKKSDTFKSIILYLDI
jgi:hypothetical protein